MASIHRRNNVDTVIEFPTKSGKSSFNHSALQSLLDNNLTSDLCVIVHANNKHGNVKP
jgi:hypothetical protein